MSKHLLLADDSITIQKVVELTFSDSGYRVTCVSSGGQALAKVREDRPDIILCDVIMPEKNGYEVTEALKSAPATRGIPIILLSGTFEPFDEERARKAGADAWITKPFESQQLVALVDEHLQKRIVLTGDAPIASTQVTGSSPSSQGIGGRVPNPSETVNMAPPADLYSAYSSPPPAAISAFSTMPPPVSAEPYAVPVFNPPSPAAPGVSAASTAAIPAVVITDHAAVQPVAVRGIEERRQAVTQDMTHRSAQPEEAVPAVVDAGGPSIRSTAPWAPLPPVVEPAPAPAPSMLEADADFGAGTMQMMVGTGVKPWEQQPPAEAFSPPEIRPEKLLEETHRHGESAPPAAIEALEPLPVAVSAVPGYVPQAERPVSPTDSTESMPALNAPPESVPAWMAPVEPAPAPVAPVAPAALAQGDVPSWMRPAAVPATPAPVPESVPAWMSAAAKPAAAPVVAAEPASAAAVPSWMAPAEPEPAATLAVPAPSWMTPAPITGAAASASADSIPPVPPVVSEPAPFVAPEISEPAPEPPPPPPPAASPAPVPAWLATPPPPPPEPAAAPVPSWLTPGAAPELPTSAELEVPPAAAFAEPQVRPSQLLEDTKRRGAAPSAEPAPIPPPAAEPDSGAFSSAATMDMMSAALSGNLPQPAPAPRAAMPNLPLTPPVAPAAAPSASPEPELAPAAGAVQLSEAQIEAIARKMVEIFGDKILREVAWEVIPDMAEMLIKNRILELEGEAAKESEKPAS